MTYCQQVDGEILNLPPAGCYCWCYCMAVINIS